MSTANSRRFLFACAICTMLAVNAFAAETHYDVFVTQNGTALVIGGYDDGTTTALIPAEQMLVFGGEVVPNGANAPYESGSPGEPGFRASVQSSLDNPSLTTPNGIYSALPSNAPLSFVFRPIAIGASNQNLYFWDGTGAVTFSPAATDVALGLTLEGAGGWTAGITGTSAGIIPGNTIETTGTGAAAGSVHEHLYTSIARAGGTPDQGFYLFSLGLQMTGLSDSQSLYFVYGALDPAVLSPEQLTSFELAHDAAKDWVQSNLVAVPEPGTGVAALGALLVGGIALARRRGRQGLFFRRSWMAG